MDLSLTSNLILFIVLLASMILAMLCTVMIRNLVKASLALAFVSALLATVMFIMNAKLAAVFELSVCAGLITVLFISTVSLTKRKPTDVIAQLTKARMKRFIYLPFLLIAVTLLLVVIWPQLDVNWLVGSVTKDTNVKEVLWYNRQVDILGQIIILLAGAFGIVLLFKERETK